LQTNPVPLIFRTMRQELGSHSAPLRKVNDQDLILASYSPIAKSLNSFNERFSMPSF